MKVGILTTHPIQYQVPWFRRLHQNPDIDLTVFFCLLPNETQQGEGFGVAFAWDIPLLEGFKYEVLANKAENPTTEKFSGCDTPEIFDIVKNGNFDAFIVNGWVVKSCLQLLWACRRNGVPCIVRGEANTLRPRAFWKRAVHRVLVSQYSQALYIGRSNKAFYERAGMTESQLHFAPYCIEASRFHQAHERFIQEKQTLRLKFGLPEKSLVFVFSGKFIQKKRPLDALKGFQLFREKSGSKSSHLLMIGAGELLESCKQFANENSLPVTFTGFLNQSEIPEAYVAADVLILASDNGETWGLVVNEGMACGLPAIVSDEVGCHPDLIIEGKTGFVYPVGDTQALADRMARFHSNPDILSTLSQNAQARIAPYNYDTVVTGTMSALRNARREVRSKESV